MGSGDDTGDLVLGIGDHTGDLAAKDWRRRWRLSSWGTGLELETKLRSWWLVIGDDVGDLVTVPLDTMLKS